MRSVLRYIYRHFFISLILLLTLAGFAVVLYDWAFIHITEDSLVRLEGTVGYLSDKEDYQRAARRQRTRGIYLVLYEYPDHEFARSCSGEECARVWGQVAVGDTVTIGITRRDYEYMQKPQAQISWGDWLYATFVTPFGKVHTLEKDWEVILEFKDW